MYVLARRFVSAHRRFSVLRKYRPPQAYIFHFYGTYRLPSRALKRPLDSQQNGLKRLLNKGRTGRRAHVIPSEKGPRRVKRCRAHGPEDVDECVFSYILFQTTQIEETSFRRRSYGFRSLQIDRVLYAKMFSEKSSEYPRTRYGT